MAKQSLEAARVNLIRIFLILGMTLLLAQGLAWADDVTVITDMKAWKHPVKDIFAKYKVEVHKVELYKNKTYPVFYVSFKYDPWLGHNNNYFTPLYYETLKANGFWDFAFVAPHDNCRINITWDKKTKTLKEDLIDLQ